jgi:phosphoenolpyruvate carboxylase
LNRREIHFPLKDAGLREDVGTLGALVGEVIREQAGERLLTEVGSARRVAIQRRLMTRIRRRTFVKFCRVWTTPLPLSAPTPSSSRW